MARHVVLLRSDEASEPRRLEHDSDEEILAGDVIVVDGVLSLVDEITESADGPPVLACRRLWKLRLHGPDLQPVGNGFIVNEQRHFGQVETLIFEAGERFRLVRVEAEWPEEFDGALVVEPLPLDPPRAQERRPDTKLG
jgi:hypothetical protein